MDNFKDLIKEGKRVAAVISKDIGVDAVEFSTAFTLYCSMLQVPSVEISEGFVEVIEKTLKGAVIGVNGMTLNGRMYVYKPEYQQYIHTEVLKSIAADVNSQEELFQSLGEIHKLWCENFIAQSSEKYRIELRQKYDAKVEALREERTKNFLGNTRGQYQAAYLKDAFSKLDDEQLESIRHLLIEHKKELSRGLTKLKEERRKALQQVDFFDESESEKDFLKEQIKIEYQSKMDVVSVPIDANFNAHLNTRFGIDFNYIEFEVNVTELFETAFNEYVLKHTDITLNDLNFYKDFPSVRRQWESEIIDFLNKLAEKGEARHSTIRVTNLLQKMRTLVKSECNDVFTRGALSPHRVLSRDEIENRVASWKDRLAREIKDSADYINQRLNECNRVKFMQLLDDYILVLQRYFGGVCEHYRAVRLSWGAVPTEVKVQLDKDIAALYDKMQLEIERGVVKAKAEAELDGILQKVITAITEGGNRGQILMLPSGVMVASNGVNVLKGLSPLDSIFKGCMTEVQWDYWQTAWAKAYTVKADTFNCYVREILENITKDFVLLNLGDLPEMENIFYSAGLKHRVDFPVLLDVNTGKLCLNIAEDMAEATEKVLNMYGKFISKLEFGDVTRKGLSEYISELKSNMSTLQGYEVGLISLESDKVLLDVVNLEKLAFEVQDLDQFTKILAVDLGLSLYKVLPKELLDEFLDIVGDMVEISKLDYHTMYEKRVDSPVERRKLMTKTVFVTELSNYIFGDSDGDLLEFFDRYTKGVEG